jgi:hypothetical protein
VLVDNLGTTLLMFSTDIQSTILLIYTSLNWSLTTSLYSIELLLNTYLLILSYQDLLIDLSEVYGIIMFVFILISSSNTTNILMTNLSKNNTNSSIKSTISQQTDSTNLNYMSVNYLVWRYTKTSSTLFSLCDQKPIR